jgi:hypothetical protein
MPYFKLEHKIKIKEDIGTASLAVRSTPTGGKTQNVDRAICSLLFLNI